jgi:hypothetical protein
MVTIKENLLANEKSPLASILIFFVIINLPNADINHIEIKLSTKGAENINILLSILILKYLILIYFQTFILLSIKIKIETCPKI